MQELLANQELLWVITVVYDLGLAILLYRFFGKYGLYTAVVLGIILGNLQGGKISELELFGYSFTASMGRSCTQASISQLMCLTKSMERERLTEL